MTFHRAFLLELEESLLAICPDMKALPYWVRLQAHSNTHSLQAPARPAACAPQTAAWP